MDPFLTYLQLLMPELQSGPMNVLGSLPSPELAIEVPDAPMSMGQELPPMLPLPPQGGMMLGQQSAPEKQFVPQGPQLYGGSVEPSAPMAPPSIPRYANQQFNPEQVS